MFKFRLDSNNVTNFKIKENNKHSFNLKQNPIYTFVLNCLEATIIKSIGFKNTYFSKVSIGGKKIKLSEFKNISLKNLPKTLRQFLGSYVYILAKARFNNVYKSYVSAVMHLVQKMSFTNNMSLFARISKVSLRAKMKFSNYYKTTVVVTSFLRLRIKLNNIQFKINTNIQKVKYLLKTKPKITYKSYVNNKITPLIKAKVKFLKTYRSNLNISLKGKAKARAKLKYEYTNNASFLIYLKERININMSSNLYLDREPLLAYSETDLINLPKKLKGFIGKRILILAKTRFNNTIESNIIFNSISKIIAKVKLSNVNSSSVNITNTKALECVRLNEYTSTNLNELPTTLFDFCYRYPTNTWNGVVNKYELWERVNQEESWRDIKKIK